MSYSAWSVVFGEQPTAAKWNILGSNDASFNDGTGIADGVIAAAKIKAEAWTSWSPSYAGTASMTWTSVSTNIARYITFGKVILGRVDASGTTGGTPDAGLLVSLPTAAKDTYGHFGAFVSDGGSRSGFAYFNTTSQLAFQRYDAGNFGAGAGRRVGLHFFYEKA